MPTTTNRLDRPVDDAYDRTLIAANAMPAALERCDCASDAAYETPEMSKGLTILYRAPRFGRMKDVAQHSGWECWRTTK